VHLYNIIPKVSIYTYSFNINGLFFEESVSGYRLRDEGLCFDSYAPTISDVKEMYSKYV
jgi:hypothetical protein